MTNLPQRLRSTAPSSAELQAMPMKDRALEQMGQRIFRTMLRKGWNQSELARRTGLSRNVISKYVNAKSFPSQESAEKLAQALDIPLFQLWGHATGADETTYAAPAVAAEPKPLELTATADGQAMLQINMKLPMATALKILSLIQEGQAG